MTLAASLAVLLALPAAAAKPSASLEKIRSWPVYDAREKGAIDLVELCRLARLPCGAVAAPGERLAAPEGPIAGRTVGELLDRILAAHPGYRAEFNESVLTVVRDGPCRGALKRRAPKSRYPVRTARVAAWLALRVAGWSAAADVGLASLSGEREDARYLNVELIVHDGATVRGVLDGLARGDGRMVWFAEEGRTSCSGFRFDNWRAPQPLDAGSVLVSVSR